MENEDAVVDRASLRRIQGRVKVPDLHKHRQTPQHGRVVVVVADPPDRLIQSLNRVQLRDSRWPMISEGFQARNREPSIFHPCYIRRRRPATCLTPGARCCMAAMQHDYKNACLGNWRMRPGRLSRPRQIFYVRLLLS